VSVQRQLAIVTGALIGVLLGLLILVGVRSDAGFSLNSLLSQLSPSSRGDGSGSNISNERRNAIVIATEAVSPAVVSVVSFRRASNVDTLPYGMTPMDQMLRAPGPRRGDALVAQAFGSGFILHGDGYILTSDHVIADAERVVVTLQDGQDLVTEVVGAAPDFDLAVLKIVGDVSGLPVAPLGNSKDLEIGEWAIAIGSPYGYLLEDTTPTVTVGVISGLNRNVKPQEDLATYYFDMIQTDAAIHAGNSGGPLVNSRGQVIGVNTFLLGGEQGSGLGFAVPIDRCRWVLEEILDWGYFRKPYYGMTGGFISAYLKASLNLSSETPSGFFVNGVYPLSPAAEAGIRPGDVIVAVNENTIPTQTQLTRQLYEARVGEEMKLRVFRNNSLIELRLTPAEDERSRGG